jgi:hypothetical protein
MVVKITQSPLVLYGIDGSNTSNEVLLLHKPMANMANPKTKNVIPIL